MDPSDLRAELAERLANSTAIDAETFNAACFVLSRALGELEFSVPEAAPLVRRLLRVAGRVVTGCVVRPDVLRPRPSVHRLGARFAGRRVDDDPVVLNPAVDIGGALRVLVEAGPAWEIELHGTGSDLGTNAWRVDVAGVG